jgi:hypothetical protein
VSAFSKLVPFLTILIAVFAVYQLVAAIIFAARGEWGFTALYVLMSIAGAALARTLWINRAKLTGKPE